MCRKYSWYHKRTLEQKDYVVIFRPNLVSSSLNKCPPSYIFILIEGFKMSSIYCRLAIKPVLSVSDFLIGGDKESLIIQFEHHQQTKVNDLKQKTDESGRIVKEKQQNIHH